MAKQTTTKKKGLTQEHLDALDKGRKAGNAVRAYLTYLEQSTPKRRGRKINWHARLVSAQASLENAVDPVERLRLIQAIQTAENYLNVAQEDQQVAVLEAGFVQWAKYYSEKHHIFYAAWRQIGVPVKLLREAGITR
jgi:hypothetical protein